MFIRRSNKRCYWLWGFILIFSFLAGLNAHPHVFVDNSITVIFENNVLKGIKVEWEFDDMFSTTLIADYDLNKDGVFDKDEMQKLKTDYFSDLIDYNYFCQVMIDHKEFTVTEIADFSAVIRNEEFLVYEFFIPLRVHKTSKMTMLLSVFDPTYYVAVINCEENPVNVIGLEKNQYSFSVIDNTSRSDYYENPMAPESIKFSLK